MLKLSAKAKETGFTLVELLVVVAIIGILSAVAVVNFQSGLDRSKQTKSLASMRGLSSALHAYELDLSYLPADGTTTTALATLLSHNLYNTVDPHDGWGHDLEYHTSNDHYTVRSYGRDGLLGPADITRETRDRFDYDMLIVDGVFTNTPER